MSTSRIIGRLLASTTALAAGVGALLPGSAASHEVTDEPVNVILAATSSAAGRAAVERLDGQVTHDLPFIDSVAATVPSAAVAALAHAPGILSVVPDEKAHVQGGFSAAFPDAVPASELPLSVYREAVRSDTLDAAGYRGEDVTIALLDTGVTPSADLGNRLLSVKVNQQGEMAPCVNLSGTPTCNDGYGHGTFMAGIIAGDGTASNGVYGGVARKANLISIKVAGDDGSADVSNVLAGIQWAVSFRNKYDIQVLNLSLGTDSTQLRSVDPLNRAVERAWDAGITVVVAASNRGPDSRTISKPGDDPFVITVGAVDDQSTPSIDDDVLPDFSSRGPVRYWPSLLHKPDVVAPGAQLVSLRAPQSTIDRAFPDPGNPYLVGSGTSMSTAVVSGIAAQILSANRTFGPNRVKFVLRETAQPVAGGSIDQVGEGIVDAHAAGINPPRGTANHGLQLPVRIDLSMARSRGQVLVAPKDDPGHPIDGNETTQLLTFDLTRFLNPWNPRTWWASQWFNNEWVETEWSGDNWEGDNWEGCFVGGDPGDECSYGDGGRVSGSKWYGAWH